jgi:hypothetical protein
MKKNFISNRLFKFLIGTLILFFLFIAIDNVYTQPPPPPPPPASYISSAHGNASSGVNRLEIADFGYSRGNCTHCHAQHGSINLQSIPSPWAGYGYVLFYPHYKSGATDPTCDLLCYKCHTNIGPEQIVNNYPYSVNFGGESQVYETIYQHFCDTNSTTGCGSRHDLDQIHDLIASNWNSWGFSADPDPCSACHNPHFARRIGNKQYNPPYNPGKSPISRPAEHKTNPLNLWGDDYQSGCPSGKNERMICYAQTQSGQYQSPYYGNTSGTMFEPSGSSFPTNGSDLPDYVTFCLDCHIQSVGTPARKAIDWTTSGDKHGGRVSNDVNCSGMWEQGSRSAPYDNAVNNYVLSCTDCHEPHGGRNRHYLIRRFINGQAVAEDTSTCDQDTDWQAICGKCHQNMHSPGGGRNCIDCHVHNSIESCGGMGGDQHTF